MNLGRKEILENKYKIVQWQHHYNINPYWFIGFVEGEGTFVIKNLVPYFQISQHNKNKVVLDAIKLYLSSIPKGVNITKNTPLPLLTISLNKNTNVLSYLINNIDVSYDYIIPFFQALDFQTRKFEDFKLWCIAVKLQKLDYYCTLEGRHLLVFISSCINKYRYSTNPEGPVTPKKMLIKFYLLNLLSI